MTFYGAQRALKNCNNWPKPPENQTKSQILLRKNSSSQDFIKKTLSGLGRSRVVVPFIAPPLNQFRFLHLSPWLNAEQSAQYSTQWPEIAVINPVSFDLKPFTFVKLTHSLELLFSGNFLDFYFFIWVFTSSIHILLVETVCKQITQKCSCMYSSLKKGK